MNIFFILLFIIFFNGAAPVLSGPNDPITEAEAKVLIEKALEPSLMAKIWDWKYSIGMTFGGVVIGGFLLKRAIRFDNKINHEIAELESIQSDAVGNINELNKKLTLQNMSTVQSKNDVNSLGFKFAGLGTIANQLHLIAGNNQHIADLVALQIETDKAVISSKYSEFDEHARKVFVQMKEGMESANQKEHDIYSELTSSYNKSISETIKSYDDFESATLNKLETDFKSFSNFKNGIAGKSEQLHNLSIQIQENLKQLGLENNDSSEVQTTIQELQNLKARVETSIDNLTQRGNRILDLINNYSSSDDEGESIVRSSRSQSPAPRSGRQSPSLTMYNLSVLNNNNLKKNDSEITDSTISKKSYNFNDDELN